jgi:hypothetical protein
MENKEEIKKFLLRLLGFTFIIVVIITASVLAEVKGPSRVKYTNDSWKNITPYIPPGYNASKHNIILDQHSHTIHSDGSLTVKQNIEWHLSMGYNTIIITDHNNLRNKADIEAAKIEYAGRAIIIQGMEWTSHRLHMNILGLKEWDFEAFPITSNPTDDQIKNAITEAHRQGAVVTLNHIPWSLNQAKMTNHPTREQMRDWGIDFIEIVNDDCHYENVYDNESIQFCIDNGIGMITGTDMHRPDGLESGAVHGWTFISAANFSEEAVMVELRARRTEIYFHPAGYLDHGNYEVNPAHMAIFPLAEVGKIFIGIWMRGLRADEIVMMVVYVYLIFAGTEISKYIKNKRLDKK